MKKEIVNNCNRMGRNPVRKVTNKKLKMIVYDLGGNSSVSYHLKCTLKIYVSSARISQWIYGGFNVPPIIGKEICDAYNLKHKKLGTRILPEEICAALRPDFVEKRGRKCKKKKKKIKWDYAVLIRTIRLHLERTAPYLKLCLASLRLPSAPEQKYLFLERYLILRSLEIRRLIWKTSKNEG